MKPTLTALVWVCASVTFGVDGTLKTGQTVSFNANGYFPEVTQIIDGDNMLVTLQYDLGVNDKGVVVETKLVWVQAPTADLSDGERGVYLEKTFEITGTKQYKTALVTKTVPILKLVTEADRKARAAKARADEEERITRDWTDTTGKHTVQAKFVRFKFEGSLVYLERTDNGKLARIPISRLSKDDQAWVREEVKRRAGK
jgi:hypothetical protein